MNTTSNIKILVRGAYDTQKLRIQMGNRICANFRAKLGITSSEKEEALDEESKNVMKQLRAAYVKITDGVTRITFKRLDEGIISTMTEFALLEQYFELEKTEKAHFNRLEKALTEYPIYNKFLKGVKGVGPAMAGVIISEIDIVKATYPSSIWKYAGLDVGPDGKGRSKRKEHLIEIDYTDSEGKEAKRVGITFNPFLKTKLLGVLGGSFLKSKSPYSQIYYDTKNRLENHATYRDVSKGHRHNMAIRKMIKMFLIDLYKEWRALEGLEVKPSYAEAKLGIVHSRQVA